VKRSIYNKLMKMDNTVLNILSIHARNDFLDKVMPKITYCNDYGQIYILFAAIILWKNSLAAFLNILLALALGLTCGEGLFKHVFKRKRPLITENNFTLLIKFPDSFSFPSGHTTSSFAVLGVTWYMNLQFKYFILVLAILIAFSRLYLYVHYPSDIVGGIVLGFICAFISIKISSHISLIKLLYANAMPEHKWNIYLFKISELRLITHQLISNNLL